MRERETMRESVSQMKQKCLVRQKVEMEVNKYRGNKQNTTFSTALCTCNYSSPQQTEKIKFCQKVEVLWIADEKWPSGST